MPRRCGSTTATNSTTATPRPTAGLRRACIARRSGDGAQSVTAAIFWLKTRAGWKETVVQENTGEIRHTFIVRMPDPIEDASEWHKRHAPHLIQ